jgi:branched-chain amino acid transport system ATP-binding protein
VYLVADFLSEGEQQMLAVAPAKSGNVKLLLPDEPFEDLARNIVKDLFKVFDQLRGRTAIMIVEHNLDMVLAPADRVFASSAARCSTRGLPQANPVGLDDRVRSLMMRCNGHGSVVRVTKLRIEKWTDNPAGLCQCP